MRKKEMVGFCLFFGCKLTAILLINDHFVEVICLMAVIGLLLLTHSSAILLSKKANLLLIFTPFCCIFLVLNKNNKKNGNKQI